MAEVYWDLEWTLQQQGFDYTYDKRLYDRLCDGHARPVREHFWAGLDYQDKMARFLENHDEPRAAAAFAAGMHEAAATITFCLLGCGSSMRGNSRGRRTRISPHLCRGPCEPGDPNLQQFYERLLAVLREPVVRNGRGNCWNACRPGKGIGPRIASSPLPGKAQTGNSCWWW